MEVMVGFRVVRGPDWTWGEQDGGEGHVGTVVEIQSPEKQGQTLKTSLPPCVATVQWDGGNRCRYRCGIGSKYDLRVLDSAPAGVKHNRIACNACEHSVTGMRWRCSRCYDYDLCTVCYMSGRHNIEHTFERMDTPRIKFSIPPRASSNKKEAKGCFPGAVVVPGCDWVKPQSIPGSHWQGKITSIIGFHGDSSRSRAEVEWREPQQSRSIHMLGHSGKVELKCVESASAGYYYPSHLPCLGTSPPDMEEEEEEEEGKGKKEATVKVGDYIRVELEADIFKAMQEDQGGSNPIMISDVLGTVGRVVSILDDGNLRARYSLDITWTICAEAVVKVDIPVFKKGQLVRVTGDWQKLLSLHQDVQRVDEYLRIFQGSVARVLSFHDNGDVSLVTKGSEWVLNPHCLTPYNEPLSLPWPHPLLVTPPNSSPYSAGDVETLRAYLLQHPDHVNRRKGGRTELHCAAVYGAVDVIQLLIDFKANVELTDGLDYRPLHYCVMNGSARGVELLLGAGANVNIGGNRNSTPLILASERDDVEVLKILINHPSIIIDEQDSAGQTALHVAVLTENLHSVKLLLDAGADPTHLDFRLYSSTIEASKVGFTAAVDCILDKDPTLIDHMWDNGNSLLHVAAIFNHIDLAILLLKKENTQVNFVNGHGSTPLHYAILRGHTAIAEQLVEHGADVNAGDVDDCVPLYMLMYKRMCMELPSDYSPETKRILHILMGDQPDNMNCVYTVLSFAAYLLRKGADMHKESKSGYSPLKIFPYLANIFTIIAENEDLFSKDSKLPGGLLKMYGGLRLVFPEKSTTAKCNNPNCSFHGTHGSRTGLTYQTSDGYGAGDYHDYGRSGSGEGAEYSSSEYSSTGAGYGNKGSGGGGTKIFLLFKQYEDEDGYGDSHSRSGSGSGGYRQSEGERYSSGSSRLYLKEHEEGHHDEVRSKPGAGSQATVSISTTKPPSPPAPSISEAEECFLCDALASVRFSPCGHLAMCSVCAPRAKKCPLCRKPVDSYSEL